MLPRDEGFLTKNEVMDFVPFGVRLFDDLFLEPPVAIFKDAAKQR